MAAEWFYTRDNKSKLGPVSTAQLQALARSGELQPTDMVRHEDISEWLLAHQIDGLFASGVGAVINEKVLQPQSIPIENPVEVGKYWWQVRPTETNVINKQGVDVIAEAMADNNKNSVNWRDYLHGRTVHHVRYDKPISGHLLTQQSPKLKEALAAVATDIPVEFRFYKTGSLSGGLRIIHPPLIYGTTDKQLLSAIIVHELRHAADFLNPQYDDTPISTDLEFDNNLYAKNLMEARAYAEQLDYLMQTLNYDKQAVIRVLTGNKMPGEEGSSPSELGMDTDIFRAAVVYLDLYQEPPSPPPQSEGWSSKTVAPFVVGAFSVFGQDIAPPTPHQPQKVVRAERQEVYQAARLVGKIMMLSRFGSYVHFNSSCA